ncbi:hypothetical protein [Ensifer sp. ZNC0028]|uniref:hypothetical protein n=1 Tax=Ensifer sp. ZNC0028 TaxID=1339236 RepID=UPI0005B9D6D1|nr:hypothetical protein [Ensifer sp. ZNC0028]
MEDRQMLTLKALALMVQQYLEERSDGLVDSYAMSAGESAIEALAAFGYMEVSEFGARFGRWTDAGRALLSWDDSRSAASEAFSAPHPSPRSR